MSDASNATGQPAGMLASYSVCSHAIWCEVRNIGEFYFVVYINAEQSSNTYMEPVTTCPGCGRGLPTMS
jgi:hypothetical protein